MPHPSHHHDHRRPLGTPIHQSASVALYNWSRGILGSVPSPDELAILQSPTIKPARDVHKLQHQEAIKLVDQSTAAHLAQIKEKIYFVKEARCHRSDLPFHVFNEIDAALFSGVLKGNVYLKWAPLPPPLFGRTIRAGRDECPRIAIELAEPGKSSRAPEEILAVLIHQMIHAFLLQCCGHRNTTVSGNGHDLRHGLEYSTIAYMIHRSFFPKKEVYYPAQFGCFADPTCLVNFRLFRHTYLQKEPGSSFCCPSGHPISFSSAGTHCEYVRSNTLAPKLDLPSQASANDKKPEYPISQYIFMFDDGSETASPHVRGSAKVSDPHIELRFKGRAYMVKRTKLSKLPSLSNRTTSDPVVNLPTDEEDEFKRLYDFIDKSEYQPPIGGRQTKDPVSGLSRGPPRIVKFEPSGKVYLLVDVKMCHLAMAMDFPELQRHVLRRLSLQSFTNEDPCAVLESIYHGGSVNMVAPKSSSESGKKSDSKDTGKKQELKRPDDAIRGWVRAWLHVESETGDYTNNLDILKRHPLWAEKYTSLRERGSELITDIDTVEAEIQKFQEQQAKERVTEAQSSDHLAQLRDYLRALLPQYLSGRPMDKHSKEIPHGGAYRYPWAHISYAPWRSQDDSEVMPNTQRGGFGRREEEILAAVIRDLAYTYPE